MQSTSLGTLSGRTVRQPPGTPQIVQTLDAESGHLCTRTSVTRGAIVALYSSITILDFVRGIIHTFLYENGLEDISGLATGDALCDSRLSAIMIGYGGANLESFLVRSYIIYIFARYNRASDFVRVSSIAAALWSPVTAIVSSVGDIDVGDAEVPGRHAMLIRSVVSISTFLLTFL